VLGDDDDHVPGPRVRARRAAGREKPAALRVQPERRPEKVVPRGAWAGAIIASR
jgi:hypothetical protein